MGVTDPVAYRVYIVGRGDDRRIEEKGQEFDYHVHVKEMYNFLATYIVPSVSNPLASTSSYLPTAVYLLLIWYIMIAVITNATTCTKHVAVRPRSR